MERRRSSRRDVAYQDKQLVITRSSRPVGLRFDGEVDALNVEAVVTVLNSTLHAHDGADLHIDVTGLEFPDVTGIRALVAAAERVNGGRKLILYGLPPLMAKVMDVVGWTDLPALTISDLEFPSREASAAQETA